MLNPIKKIGLFATPDSAEALQAYCEGFTGSERVIAYTLMGMTNNLCHVAVDKAIKQHNMVNQHVAGEEGVVRMKLTMFRGSDYNSPVDAEEDGALYDTGIRITRKEFEDNTSLYQAVAMTASNAIDGNGSNLKLALVQL